MQLNFKKRTPTITTPKNKINNQRETPWGTITYLEYKKKLSLEKEFDEIDKFCKKLNIIWFAKPGISLVIIF